MERVTSLSEISATNGKQLEESDFEDSDEEIPTSHYPKRLKTDDVSKTNGTPDGATAVKPKPVPRKPFFELESEGKDASVDLPEMERNPLFLSDIQELLMFAMRGGTAPKPGPWCSLTGHIYVSHVALVLIEGLARDDFVEHRDCFPSLDAIFSSKVEVITPSAYSGSFIETLIVIPISKNEQNHVLRGYGSLAGALLEHTNFYNMVPVVKLPEKPTPPSLSDVKIGQKPPLDADKEEAEEQKSIDENNLMYERFVEVLKVRRQHERNKEALLQKNIKKLSNPSAVEDTDPALQKLLTYKEREKLRNARLEVSEKELAVKLAAERRKTKRCSMGLPTEALILPPTDKFPRTDLIMSPEQLIAEGIPIPLKGAFRDRYNDYVMTKDLYKPVTPVSPMFALDCEMVMTTAANGTLELARVSIVNEENKCIYDELVLPHNKITHYLTHYSGITAGMLQGVTKRLNDVRREIRTLLPMDAILIGHSICNDLHTLRMMHPYLIDTSIIFNINTSCRRKAKLSVLAQEFLGMSIQTGVGHCSSEDSIACMKLVQLKLANNVSFGDTILESNISQTGQRSPPIIHNDELWRSFLLTGKKTEDCMLSELTKYHPLHAEKLSKESCPLDSKVSFEDQVMEGKLNGKLDGMWMEKVKLAAPLFRMLKSQNKPAALVSTSDIVKEYVGWLPKTIRKIGDLVSVISARDNRELLERTAVAVRLNLYTIAHARFVHDLVEKASVEDKKVIFTEIDKSCKRIWDSMAEDGLCVVVFGGRSAGTNGACFIQINNDLTCKWRTLVEHRLSP